MNIRGTRLSAAGQPGRLRRRIATAAALPLVAVGLMTAVPGQAFAATQAKCEVSGHLSWGRGVATSTCTAIQGPRVAGAKQVNEHRAKIMCAVVRGRGTPHDIVYTYWGPWEPVGKQSTVECSFSSSTAGFDYETR
jgi:hypothetical protein